MCDNLYNENDIFNSPSYKISEFYIIKWKKKKKITDYWIKEVILKFDLPYLVIK